MRLFLSALLVGFGALVANGQMAFTNVAPGMGTDCNYGTGYYAGGVSFYDFNKDGLDDLSFTSGQGNPLYFFENTGTGFMAITPFIDDTLEVKQINWVDYDNDGDNDLFITRRYDMNSLYENDGAFNFTDVTIAAGLPVANRSTYGTCWGDYNKDGHLDFYVSNYGLDPVLGRNFLFRSNGDGTFTDVTSSAGLHVAPAASFQASFVDVDNDGWADLYVANDKEDSPNWLYVNNGDGTFTDATASSGAGVIMDAMCVSFGDYNNNGFMDLYVTNTPSVGNLLFRNNGDQTFGLTSSSAGVGMYTCAWGSSFFDADNDGDQDLYACSSMLTNAYPNTFYENTGAGTFVTTIFDGDSLISFGSASGDFNNDGYPDVAVSNHIDNPSMLWESPGGTNHWIKANLQGTVSNRDAIGTWVKAYAGGTEHIRYTANGESFCSQNSGTVMIGTGTNDMIDSLVVTWPSGLVERFYGVCTGVTLNLVEGANTVPGLVTVTADDGEVCLGGSLELTASAPGAVSFTWNGMYDGASYTISEGGFYSVAAFSASGLCSMSSLTINELPSPIVDDVVYNVLTASTYEATVEVSDGTAPYTYLWDDAAGTTDATASDLEMDIDYQVVVADSEGCETIETVRLESGSVGLYDPAFDISLYPNPATTEVVIAIQAQGEMLLQIADLQGRTVLSQNVFADGQPISISLKDLSAGTYMLHLEAEGRTSSSVLQVAE